MNSAPNSIGKLLAQVLQRVDSAADAVAGFQDNDGQTFCGQFRSCNQPSCAGANYDHVGAILFCEFTVLTGHAETFSSRGETVCDRTRAQLR